MIIQYGKRAGGKIWSTTAARKASARIIRKNQGPVDKSMGWLLEKFRFSIQGPQISDTIISIPRVVFIIKD